MTEGDPGSTPPAGNPPSGDPPPAPAGTKTFTQEELDRLIGERVKREREKYADYDALKGKAAELDKLQESQKSELERAQETAKKAEEERTKVLATANERLLRAEVKSIAADLRIVDADAAYALMSRDAVKVSDTGDVEGVKAALEALIKAKPYLVQTQSGPPGSATNPPRGGSTGSGESDAERRRRLLG